jgi:hypothetical protein
MEIIPPRTKLDTGDETACSYIIDDAAGRRRCGERRQFPHSYCPQHHSLCYITCGSKAETRRLREVEALASAVGGRRARPGVRPSDRFLERLEKALRSKS